MKIPISKRLRLCAQLVPEGARVADIGTDHGYLGLYLLQNGLAAHVLAADLRPQPLQTAKLHAAKFGFAGQMEFRLSDGLAEIGTGRGRYHRLRGHGRRPDRRNFIRLSVAA